MMTGGTQAGRECGGDLGRGASPSSLAHSRSSGTSTASPARKEGYLQGTQSFQVSKHSGLCRARSLSGHRPLGWEATAGTTSGARSCWVAVYRCAQGCLLGALEAMK